MEPQGEQNWETEIPFPLTKDNIANWKLSGRLMFQHPGNYIDYSHPIVHKHLCTKDNHTEKYFIFPNDPKCHTPLPPLGGRAMIQYIPGPEQEAPLPPQGNVPQIPYHYKEVYMQKLEYVKNKNSIQDASNAYDYTLPCIKRNYRGEFYKVERIGNSIKTKMVPQIYDSVNPGTAVKEKCYPLPEDDTCRIA